MKYKIVRKIVAAMTAVGMMFTMSAAALPAYAATAEDTSQGLVVGAGIANITPTSDMYPMTWGSGNRGFAFIGALEDIYVRVIALSNDGEEATPENTSLIVSFDTGKGPYAPGFISLLSEYTGVPEENIFWSTTHVHSTPEITNADWADALDMEIRDDDPANTLADLSARNKARWGCMLEKQLITAAQDAIDAMRPAEVALSTTTSYINVNRDTMYESNLIDNPLDPEGEQVSGSLEGYNGQGFSDKTLTVVEFRERSEEQKPIAFITHYAMHNVLLYANDYFNPDYNEAHGVTVATDEDIEVGTYDPGNPENTVLSTKLEFNVAYSDTYEKNFRSLETLTTADNVDGLTAANAAVHPDIGGLVSQYVESKYEGAVSLWLSGAAGDQNPILRNTFNFESPVTGEVLEIPVDGGMIEPAVYYASIQFRDVQNAIAQIADEDNFASDTTIDSTWGRTEIEPIDAQYTDSNGELQDYANVPVSLTVMKIGDIVLAGFPGEYFNSIGVAMRDESELGDTPSENILVVNHCWTHEEENNHRSYYPDDYAISRYSNRWGVKVKYPQGTIVPTSIGLLEDLWANLEE